MPATIREQLDALLAVYEALDDLADTDLVVDGALASLADTIETLHGVATGDRERASPHYERLKASLDDEPKQ